ncbi:nuclear body protein SP140-like protein isoform X2 [Chanodichthys erythropterus]|uniref:nuclear body protein SP140-like protein isoform X2 n=1 Tax=Chanodichthys erythropterus TaxID=933992 RepID=UPI00351E506A
MQKLSVCKKERKLEKRQSKDTASVFQKTQNMESISVIDITSESESECKWDPERSTGSDSSSDNDIEKRGKQEKKRKMRKRSCKQKGPRSLSTPNKKRPATDTSQYLSQKYENKLPVTCGDKKGVLYVEKYNYKQKCILSEGQWFKPIEFEQFGGKERCKNSTKSIFCDGIPLRKLIEDRVLLPFKKRLVQNEQIDSPESSPVTGRLKKRKFSQSREQLHPSTSESNDMDNGDDGNDVDDDGGDDDVDMTVFEGPTLPVTCGSMSGVLHKCRFAKGHSGRCIRTEDSWLSPEDFIRLNKPNGTWRKDIVTKGLPLGKLIMKRVLEPHMINCYCEICEEQDQYQNDDMCFVCESEGDLVCCDECPRAFHSHCHLPAADGDSLGQWSCTFCVMKNMKDSSQKTQQEVLSSPVSQYTLHCQYLLLHLLHESMTDSCTNVSGHSENICGPMMLGRVKLNLENNDYQTVQEFVSDIEEIFNNCCTSNGDNDSSRMTSRLKEAFKKEFETVFKLL